MVAAAGTASAEFLGAVVRLLRLPDQPGGAIVLAPLVEREIPAADHRRIRRDRGPAGARQVGCAWPARI
ncbi:AraC family transcriptional regulator N-terminal domain-containing protein [Nonomuraea sp. NPDC051191]|uniref:AraC family transcriptional regulator N-terminal domain-containing protein n=1 Tax=Nonomuraea sp. NPDC051191 TaxID=3364372 RepID=UPI0037B4EDC1